MGDRPAWWLAVVLIIASALHFLAGQFADPDLWQHLLFGQIILRDGSFPRSDAFSYTAYGAPLVNHEWLAQVFVAGLYGVGGSPALIAFKLLVAAAVVALLVDAVRTLASELAPEGRVHPLPAAAGLVLALAVIAPGASFRPQLFTIALLAAQGSLLARADRRLRSLPGRGARISWELALQPVLLGAWANLHGGFLVGLAQLGIFAGAVALRAVAPARWRRGAHPPSAREARLAIAVALASVAATLINPNGIALYAFLARTLGVHDEISEWQPVALLSGEFLRFKVLVAGTAIALAALWRQRRACEAAGAATDWRAAFLALAALAGFRHQRHTVLFAVAAAPVLVVGAERLRLAALARFPGLAPRPAVLAVAGVGALAVAAAQLAGYARTIAEHGLAIRFGRLDYPADAVEFLRAHHITGNVAMPFEWGSYALWKLGPDWRVFIDGRFETVYPERVIRDYFAFMHGTEGWERLLDDYPTDIVVVQRWRDIHPRLFARKDFEYVYSDPAALVFVRRQGRMQPALDRLALLADRTAFERPDTVFP